MRRIEGTDHVLVTAVVDAGLAADCRVDHGQEGCGKEDKPDSPHVEGRRETGGIGEGSSAHRGNRAVAVHAAIEGAIQNAGDLPEALRGLTGRHYQDATRGSRLLLRGGEQCGGVLIEDREDVVASVQQVRQAGTEAGLRN